MFSYANEKCIILRIVYNLVQKYLAPPPEKKIVLNSDLCMNLLSQSPQTLLTNIVKPKTNCDNITSEYNLGPLKLYFNV